MPTTKFSSISIRNLKFSYNIDKVIFDDVSLTISPKEKVAIMGQNGAGKSTLCKIFANHITDYQGEINIDKNTNLVYAEQQMPEKFYHWSILDFLLEAKQLRGALKDYFLIIELLAFDNEFKESCEERYNASNNIEWTLSEILEKLDTFIHTEDIPELFVSEACAVELMVELEDMSDEELSAIKVDKLLYTQSLKFLKKCPDAEITLNLKEFVQRFRIYLKFLETKSFFQYYAKTKYMNETLLLLGEAQELYERSGGHDIENGMRNVLKLVNLEKLDTNLPIELLSGGQKTRLLLSQSIFQNPDILILDEPTNNLDKYSYKRLTTFVKNFKKTLIVISHDTEFLNSFVEKVLYIDSNTHKIREYYGTFDQVQKEIDEQMKRERSEAAKINIEIKKKKSIYTARAQQAKVYDSSALAKNVQQLKKKIDVLEDSKSNRLKEDRVIAKFTLVSKVIDGSLLAIEKIGKWDGEKAHDINFNFEVPKSSFVLLRGENGIGKSWFIKESIAYAKAMEVSQTDIIPSSVYNEIGINPTSITPEITKELQNHQNNQLWSEGNSNSSISKNLKNIVEHIFYSPLVKLGYYSQDFSTLNFKNTVQQEMESVHPFKYEELRSTLARFMFSAEHLDQIVEELSEGQKALLSWAKLCFLKSNVLFLDEPTNHINFRHLPILSSTLQNYKGVTILICHDEEFVRDLPISHVLDMQTEKVWNWREWKKWN